MADHGFGAGCVRMKMWREKGCPALDSLIKPGETNGSRELYFDDFDGRGDDAQVALLAFELLLESLDLPVPLDEEFGRKELKLARLRLNELFLPLLHVLAHLLLEDALRLVVLEVRIVQGVLLIVLGAHELGALLGDGGARVAVHAHQGELLVVRGALLSDGALHGRPLAYLDDFDGLIDGHDGHCDDAQIAFLAVELVLESLHLVEVAQRNLLSVVRLHGRQARNKRLDALYHEL
eukprot:scaffold95526_cov63-Phaeocystis_antarctica.AAC.4